MLQTHAGFVRPGWSTGSPFDSLVLSQQSGKGIAHQQVTRRMQLYVAKILQSWAKLRKSKFDSQSTGVHHMETFAMGIQQ